MPLRKVAARHQTHAQTPLDAPRLPLAPCRIAARAPLLRLLLMCVRLVQRVIFRISRAARRPSSRQARIFRAAARCNWHSSDCMRSGGHLAGASATDDGSGGGISPPFRCPHRRLHRRPADRDRPGRGGGGHGGPALRRRPIWSPVRPSSVGLIEGNGRVGSLRSLQQLAALARRRLAALALASSLRSRERSLRSQDSPGSLAALARISRAHSRALRSDPGRRARGLRSFRLLR